MVNLTVDTKDFLRLRAILGVKTFIARVQVVPIDFAASYLLENQSIDWTRLYVEGIPENICRYNLVVAVQFWLLLFF